MPSPAARFPEQKFVGLLHANYPGSPKESTALNSFLSNLRSQGITRFGIEHAPKAGVRSKGHPVEEYWREARDHAKKIGMEFVELEAGPVESAFKTAWQLADVAKQFIAEGGSFKQAVEANEHVIARHGKHAGVVRELLRRIGEHSKKHSLEEIVHAMSVQRSVRAAENAGKENLEWSGFGLLHAMHHATLTGTDLMAIGSAGSLPGQLNAENKQMISHYKKLEKFMKRLFELADKLSGGAK